MFFFWHEQYFSDQILNAVEKSGISKKGSDLPSRQ